MNANDNKKLKVQNPKRQFTPQELEETMLEARQIAERSPELRDIFRRMIEAELRYIKRKKSTSQ